MSTKEFLSFRKKYKMTAFNLGVGPQRTLRWDLNPHTFGLMAQEEEKQFQ